MVSDIWVYYIPACYVIVVIAASLTPLFLFPNIVRLYHLQISTYKYKTIKLSWFNQLSRIRPFDPRVSDTVLLIRYGSQWCEGVMRG